MLKKMIMAGVILAVGIGGFMVLNQDSQSSRANRSPVTPAAENTSSNTNETGRPNGGQANAGGEGQRPTGNRPANSENADGENSEASADEAQSQRQQQGGRRGMGMFGRIAQQAATSVEVMRPAADVQDGQLSVYGMVEAQTSTVVRATSAATVDAIGASEGDAVLAGQSLVTLSSDSTVEQLKQREASLAELDARIRNESLKHENDLAALAIEEELVRIAKNAVDRFNSLNAQQLSSNTDYESALRTYQSQLLSLQNRQLTIAQYEDSKRQTTAQREQLLSQIRQSEELVTGLSLSAPFDGLVAQLNITQQQELNAGETIATLYDPNSLVMTVRVPVRYRLDQSELNQITAIDSEGRTWQANAVRPINEDGAQRLTLVPSNDASDVPLPGTHVPLTLFYPINEPTVAIPTTALYDQQRVYVFDRETRAIKAVDVSIKGRTDDGFLISFLDESNADLRAPIITTRLKNPVTGMQVSLVRPNQGDRP